MEKAELIEKIYNPFRMVGSWIGAFIGGLIYITSYELNKPAFGCMATLEALPLTQDCIFQPSIFIIIICSVLGFLAGWMIQMLFITFQDKTLRRKVLR